MAKHQKNKDCPQFAILRSLLPPQARKPVWDTMNKLWPRYRDELCDAALAYVQRGRYHHFADSLVMQRQFRKIVEIIDNGGGVTEPPPCRTNGGSDGATPLQNK